MSAMPFGLMRSGSHRKAIANGASVADLGSGSGVLGLLCLQAGAGRLFAVDDSDMLEVAREALTRSGYGDGSAFIRGKSSQIELPERVDMVICDHVGYFGFDYGVVEFFADARKRFLKPGGNLTPASIRLNIAAVGAQRCDELANGWRAEGIPEDFHWLRKHAVNTIRADNPEFFSWNAEQRLPMLLALGVA